MYIIVCQKIVHAAPEENRKYLTFPFKIQRPAKVGDYTKFDIDHNEITCRNQFR